MRPGAGCPVYLGVTDPERKRLDEFALVEIHESLLDARWGEIDVAYATLTIAPSDRLEIHGDGPRVRNGLLDGFRDHAVRGHAYDTSFDRVRIYHDVPIGGPRISLFHHGGSFRSPLVRPVPTYYTGSRFGAVILSDLPSHPNPGPASSRPQKR